MPRSALLVTTGALLISVAPLLAQDSSGLPVEVVTTRFAPIERSFEAAGEVVAREAIVLAFPQGGRVVEVLVDEGARVEAGQVLARTDPVQQEQTLRAARAALATAEANGRQAAIDLAREEALLARGVTTRALRDEASNLARSADALISQAIATVEAAETALADTELAAPVAGQVIARDVEPGQVVSDAQTVIELATNAGFDAVFDIPEAFVAQARDEVAAVQLTLTEGAPPSFEGFVREVSPQIDPATGTVEATVTIEGAPDGIAYGASIWGSVSSTEAAGISLPNWTLTGQGDGAAVWVVDPATSAVALREVTVLRHVDGQVILSEGLADGEWVVGRGAHLMFPGRVVIAAEVR